VPNHLGREVNATKRLERKKKVETLSWIDETNNATEELPRTTASNTRQTCTLPNDAIQEPYRLLLFPTPLVEYVDSDAHDSDLWRCPNEPNSKLIRPAG